MHLNANYVKELKTNSALSARGPQLFDMYMPSSSLHPSSEFSGASAMRFLLAICFLACEGRLYTDYFLSHPSSVLKKRGETLVHVLCFFLLFFRALDASCVLNNRTAHSQGVFICYT